MNVDTLGLSTKLALQLNPVPTPNCLTTPCVKSIYTTYIANLVFEFGSTARGYLKIHQTDGTTHLWWDLKGEFD